ncbi:hypothetical protein [Providencia sp. Me31A]|uniref:hypothetical protein n=1 Tax=Providencia sp. Me31A TaxID=3392637 RepID=UPI003D28DC44
MERIGLQTQRNLESFLSRLGISKVNMLNEMSFIFPEHYLFLELVSSRIIMKINREIYLDDEDILLLHQRLDPEMTRGYLFRAYRTEKTLSLNVTLSEDISSETLHLVYSIMLRLLSPLEKNRNNG